MTQRRDAAGMEVPGGSEADQLRRLRLATEQSPAAVMIADRHGRIQYVNRRFTEMTGYRPEDAIGRTPSILKSGITPRAVYDELWATIQAGGVWRGELCNRRKSGELYWHSASISPVRDADGALDGFVSIQEDISEQRATFAALIESESRFRSVLDAARFAVWDWDLTSDQVTWLGHFAEIFGTPPDGLNENYASFLARVHPDDREQVQDKLAGSLRDAAEASHSFRVVWPDGTIRWVFARGQFRYGPDLTPLRMYGAIMDITERRALEGQLLQAQKIEAVGQLASGIAHEINTPTQYVGDNLRFLQEAFTGLLGIVAASRELAVCARDAGLGTSAMEAAWARADGDFLLEEIPRAAAQALEGTERVSRIVRAMKEFAHPGGDVPVPEDLNRAVNNIVTVARNEWKYVAELHLDLDPELPPVPCRLGEIHQAILNLVVNAAHAIHERYGEGGEKGTITVSTCCVDGFVHLRVQDTGAGIPEAIRLRIFDPFFTTKEVGRGTGQGLAITQDVVVRRHGGTLSFESVVGEGTTFHLTLPLRQPPEIGARA